jgi:hypothetical protein
MHILYVGSAGAGKSSILDAFQSPRSVRVCVGNVSGSFIVDILKGMTSDKDTLILDDIDKYNPDSQMILAWALGATEVLTLAQAGQITQISRPRSFQVFATATDISKVHPKVLESMLVLSLPAPPPNGSEEQYVQITTDSPMFSRRQYLTQANLDDVLGFINNAVLSKRLKVYLGGPGNSRLMFQLPKVPEPDNIRDVLATVMNDVPYHENSTCRCKTCTETCKAASDIHCNQCGYTGKRVIHKHAQQDGMCPVCGLIEGIQFYSKDPCSLLVNAIRKVLQAPPQGSRTDPTTTPKAPEPLVGDCGHPEKFLFKCPCGPTTTHYWCLACNILNTPKDPNSDPCNHWFRRPEENGVRLPELPADIRAALGDLSAAVIVRKHFVTMIKNIKEMEK